MLGKFLSALGLPSTRRRSFSLLSVIKATAHGFYLRNMNHTCIDLAEGLAAKPGSERAVTYLWGRISAFNVCLTIVTIPQTCFFFPVLAEIILIYNSLNQEWISKCYPYTRVTVRLNFIWNTSEELLSFISTERENPDAFLGSGTLYLRVA